MCRKKICRLVCLQVLGAIIVLAMVLVHRLQQPTYNGYVYYKQGYGAIRISRDRYGVPYILANTLTSSLFGLGYAHAQDRLFQLHLHRLVSQGRLSEIFGSETLELDKKMRTFGFSRIAWQMEKHLSPEAKANLQAYADGINEFLNQTKILPPEFYILNIDFPAWSVHDSLSFYKLLVFQMSADHNSEILRSVMEKLFGRKMADIITSNDPSTQISQVTIMNDEELKLMNIFSQFAGEEKFEADRKHEKSTTDAMSILQYSIPDYLNQLYQGGGSNSWVISGEHTYNGKPILADDPHLPTKIPTLWYQSAIYYYDNELQQNEITGVTIPGIPGLMIIQSNYLSFGVTVLYTDTTDYLAETIQNNSYLYEGKYIEMKAVHEEKISIKGQSQPFVHHVMETHHGPVFRRGEIQYLDQDVSFMWPGHVQNDTMFDGIYGLYRAKNLSELKAAFDLCTGPHLAIVWCTTDGHIGFVGTGLIPIRKKLSTMGHINNGSLAENEWVRYLSKEERPWLVDPKKGYIVAANNNFATKNFKHNVNYNQITTSRADRICSMIESLIRQNRKITIDDVIAMQTDELDIFSVNMTKNLISIFDQHATKFLSHEQIGKLKPTIEQLRRWNSFMSADSVGATIYFVWEHELYKTFFALEFPDKQYRQQLIQNRISYYMLDQFFIKEVEKWTRDPSSADAHICQSQLTSIQAKNQSCLYNVVTSLWKAVEIIEEKLGSDIAGWQYGKLHLKCYPHTPFTNSKILSYFFDRSYGSGGNRRTVQVSQADYSNNLYRGVHSAQIRVIYSLGNPEGNLWVLDTGISGNVLSKHYDDQMKLYAKGQYIKAIRNKDEIYQLEDVLILAHPTPTGMIIEID